MAYEFDYAKDKYVTTDYITTDARYSYAVTRIGWLSRSRSDYKVWNTETGLTEGVFATWTEARRKAIQLATRANAPVRAEMALVDGEDVPEQAAEAVTRAKPPKDTPESP